MINNYSLDLLQKSAVESEIDNLLIVAAPGSGKTTVITNRIKYLISNKKVNPSNIVVITFSKMAALDMEKRYKAISSDINVPFFGTIHALFYSILKNQINNVKIIEKHISLKIIRDLILNYTEDVKENKIEQIINAICVYKANDNLINNNFEMDKKIFYRCLKIYEEYKKDNKLMDFYDLQISCRKALEEEALLNYYKNKFKYILIDEFQDCDEIQINILKTLVKGNSIFAVGDEDQCIYGFRGACPKYMVTFKEHFYNSSILYLSTNYRCDKSIVDFSRRLISYNRLRNNKAINPYKKNLNNINIIWSLNEKKQAENIIKDILKNTNINTAILYRTNKESVSLVDVLVCKDIDFTIMGERYNFYSHFICKDIIAYLTLTIDLTCREAFLRIINKPFRYISKIDLKKLEKYPYKDECFNILINVKKHSLIILKVINLLKKKILHLRKIPISEVIEYILYKLEYHHYLKELCNKNHNNLEQYIEIINKLKEEMELFNSIDDFLKHLKKQEKALLNKTKEGNPLILSTIHSVKGMEFERVYIINCNEGYIPHKNSITLNIEEERRLFYVASTRAISYLNLCICEKEGNSELPPSRFLYEGGLLNKE